MKKFFISSALIITLSAGTALSIYASNYYDEGKTDAPSSPTTHNEINTDKEMKITDVNNPNNPYVTPSVELSEEDIKRGQESLDIIINPFGTFNKVAKKDSSISEEETVDNLDDVTADTEQILHHGNYFVKSDS
ncbi:hypothetical protein [Paenibacillus xylanexedens]|uniref:hypothetical protein n=1 Tax=Paenibacillus xylanexedens TaxID=528191 RepID=UPI00119DE885|nr:hypothetical protein [Paenibacillus xylanexedens]